MVSACSRSVCSLRLFSCSSFPLMLASSLVMVLSDCARSDDDGSGAVAPVLEALSVSLPSGGAGTGLGSSTAASCSAGGCAGISAADACGGCLRTGACARGPRAFAAVFNSGTQPVQPRKILLCALDLVVGPRQPAIGAHRVRLGGIRLLVIRLLIIRFGVVRVRH